MPRATQAPPPGIARMATPEATSGRWFDANNVRFRQGQLMPVGGNVILTGSNTPTVPRDLITWHDNAMTRWAAIGTDAKLWAFNLDTQTIYDITPAGVPALEPPGSGATGYGMGDYGTGNYGVGRATTADVNPGDISADLGDKWSMDTWGQDLLVVPTQDGHLFHWTPATPATVAAVVPAAPINNRGVIVTDQRQVVLLGAGGDPRNIAWSDQESYTVWTPAVANLAGSKELLTQSYALTAVKVSSGVLIYTNNDLHLMTYVGPPYAYGITQIASGCGPLSMRAVVAIGSTVVWPGRQNFWTWAGSVQALPCEVNDWFFSSINRDMVGRVFGSPNQGYSEMWWDWPDHDSKECNRYVAVNFTDQTRPWTIGMRARTAGEQRGMMDSPILGGPSAAGSTSGALFIHEFGWTDNGIARASTGSVYAQSGAITLGEGDQRHAVTQLVYDATDDPTGATPAGTNMVGYQFTCREQPYDAAGQTTTPLYTTLHDGLIDMRFSGRTCQMRMQALADGYFAIGRPRLVMTQAGRR